MHVATKLEGGREDDTRVCKFIVIDEKLKFRHTSIIQKIRRLEGLGLV